MIWLLAGCVTGLSDEALRDPRQCADCHPNHVDQWSGSMHAYAGEDPLFRALNALGQQETAGELGDFCVQCHAPVAVELGLTTNGLNLEDVPEHLRGVTCYSCHQVDAVEGTHNNPLRLALDNVMRGGFPDPTPSRAHQSAYSPLQDRREPASADLCGSCHDVVTPLGGHIEATYAEWSDSLFTDPAFGLTCGSCHMRGSNGIAADLEGVPLRRVHDHSFPGVDVAVTPFPNRDAQRDLVQQFLDDSLAANLCVQSNGSGTTPVVIALDNVAAGHSFPSGATSDRRVWVEVEAFAGDTLVWSSGSIPDDQAFSEFVAGEVEPVWSLHSELKTAAGDFTHRFWEAADIDDESLLRVHTTLDPTDPEYVRTVQFRNYLVRGKGVDRVRMAVHLRPMPLDLVDELIAGGWLAPEVRSELPTYTLAPTVLEWTADVAVNAGNLACVPEPPPERN